MSTSTIVAVAEAIGSLVERIRTPSIDWKHRALEAEGSEAESNELLEFITRESEALESQLFQVAELLAECGAPRLCSFGRETSARERAEWLKRKIAESELRIRINLEERLMKAEVDLCEAEERASKAEAEAALFLEDRERAKAKLADLGVKP